MSSVIAPVDQLICAVYVSSAHKLLDDAELLELLQVARQNNQRSDVTGMLLYRDGNFLQVLEGPAPAVDALIDKIKRDTRHHGLILMSRRGIEERQFSDWQMAFRNMSNSHMAEEGYSPFLEPTFDEEEEEETGEASQLVFRLLRRFKDVVR
jgi:hypothetical protein